jgi:hypothetical protein
MSIPNSPPNRYTSSRQTIAGSDINNLSDRVCSFQALTAIGAAQATAAAIDAANIEVLAGSANNAGVRLPVSYPGAEVAILNNSANNTIVYGNGTDTIQSSGTAFTATMTMATLTSTLFFCIKKGFWQRAITA